MPTEVKTKTEELRETENEDEAISVEEMTQILKTKGIDIKSLALEAKKLRKAMENGEYETTEQTGTKKLVVLHQQVRNLLLNYRHILILRLKK